MNCHDFSSLFSFLLLSVKNGISSEKDLAADKMVDVNHIQENYVMTTGGRDWVFGGFC